MAVSNDNNLLQAIQHLYEVFAAYTSLSDSFGACSWFSEQDISRLKSTPVRELSAQELEVYSWHLSWCGTENDFKHFLPRLLDLFSSGELPIPPDFFLPNLSWSGWSSAETASIDSVLVQLWVKLINTFPFAFGPDEFLCGLAMIYPDMNPFLQIWEKADSLEALRQLAMLSQEATYCGTWERREAQKQQMVDWLLSSATIQRLEMAVSNYPELYGNEFLEAAITLQEWKDNFSSA